MTGGYIATQGFMRRYVPDDPTTEHNRYWYSQAQSQYMMALKIAISDKLPNTCISDAAKNVFKLNGEQAMCWLRHNNRTNALIEYCRAMELAVSLVPYLGDAWVKRVDVAEKLVKSAKYGFNNTPTEQFSILMRGREVPDRVCLRIPGEEY